MQGAYIELPCDYYTMLTFMVCVYCGHIMLTFMVCVTVDTPCSPSWCVTVCACTCIT